jgi:hypothetical protein
VNAGEQECVEFSECKNAIALLMSVLRKCDIAFEGVRDAAKCNRTMDAADIRINVLCHSCLRECDFANALSQTRCMPYSRMHRLMPVYSVK